MQEQGLLIFSTYLLRSFVPLFWGGLLIFYRKRSKQNLPISCIFIVVGLLYFFNSFYRLPSLSPCDVYNVFSYFLLIFIAPFTIFYANYAINKQIRKTKYLLHFIPLLVMLLLYLLLRIYQPRIPFCYNINQILDYASDYPLYTAYYLLLIAVFMAQVFTYFSKAFLAFWRLRSLYKKYGYSMKPINKLFAMDFMFLFYPLFGIVFLSYNNYVPIGVAHNFIVSVVITTMSILCMKLRLPLRTRFLEKKIENPENLNAEEETAINEVKLLREFKELFEIKEIYKYSELTLQDIAKKLNINRSYLSAFINRSYGYNFKKILTNYRLEAAKKLLSDNSIDIKKVAFKVGFKSRSAFYKAFKENVSQDLTPLKWRKQI